MKVAGDSKNWRLFMKVMQLIHTRGHGGAENTFRWLCVGLQRRGVDVIAAISESDFLANENWIEHALNEVHVPYVTFDKSGSPLRLLKNIGVLIDKVNPDIVHSHLLDSNFYSSLACKIRNLPHICTEHGDVSFGLTATAKIKYRLISFCSHSIICVSDAIRQIASSVISHQVKLKTVYNGIHFIEPCISTFRAEFGISLKSLVIGNVGNLYPVKGQLYLISAFSELLKTCPLDIYLVLVGRGSEKDALSAMVRKLGIPENRVIFTGFRNDIENILNAMDIYVQPSLSEGHPIALLEAMSLGIPVISTSVGGVPEIIGKNIYGTLVPPGNTSALLNSLKEFIDSSTIFIEKASITREYIFKNFSINKMTSDYLEQYQAAIN